MDVRIVCATNRNVEKDVAEGRFRENLCYRLNVISIILPALRNRGEDLPRIADALVRAIAVEERRSGMSLSPASREALHAWRWPGNVRELQNVLRRGIITSPTAEIDLPFSGDAGQACSERFEQDVAVEVPRATFLPRGAALAGRTLAEIERAAIEGAIELAGGNICKAAKVLDVSPSTIYRKIERWQNRAG